MAYNPEKLVSMGRMSEILARTKQEYENKITTEARRGAVSGHQDGPQRFGQQRDRGVLHPGEGTGSPRMGMCSW